MNAPAAAELLAQQQHGPGGAAHAVLLAGVVVAALVLVGVRWWRTRDARADEQSTAHDRSAESTRSTEDE